jgi:4-hydroxy-tetrahydrodipicolinate reductase
MTYRVVQWATGNIGTHSLRSVIEHPEMSLAGVYVYSAGKEGKDAGDLCGGPPTGVRATRDIGEITDLAADCVLYMPSRGTMDEVVRLLESGANVVTTRGEFHRPAGLDPALRAELEDACQRGRSSLHSTGSSPGFITEAVPLVLTSIQRRLDSLVIDEFADLSERESPQLLFDVMGFGKPPSAFDERRLGHLRTSFGPSLQLVGEALGTPLDTLEASGEVATARRPVRIAAGELPAGTVAAQRLQVTGLHDGRPLLTFRSNWYCTIELEPQWDLRTTGWRISVAGDAPIDVDMYFPVPPERMGAVFPGYTANRAVNAIPFVCTAEPGIRTTLDLPQIVATLS